MTIKRIVICFLVKHGVRFIINLIRREKFALNILKSFPLERKVGQVPVWLHILILVSSFDISSNE